MLDKSHADYHKCFNSISEHFLVLKLNTKPEKGRHRNHHCCENLRYLHYADDTALLADNIMTIKRVLNIVNGRRALKLNGKNCMVRTFHMKVKLTMQT